MSNPTSRNGSREGWADTAVGYVEKFGWQIVPLHINPQVKTRKYTDAVIRQLGHVPLVDVPEEALSEPADIREWGETQPAQTPFAVLTGSESDLVALEVGTGAERALSPEKVQQVCNSLPDTRHIEGPDRDYYLFTIPTNAPGLPSLTRQDGFILHGENSLIRVPKNPGSTLRQAYHWDITSGDEIVPLPNTLLSFFGIKTGVEGLIAGGEASNSSPRPSSQSNGHGSSESLSENGSSRSTSGEPGSLGFQSGEDLYPETEGSALGIPWLAKGALTVLTGAPKTAGKSTFSVNLAAHLAAGRAFLEYPLQAADIVVLSDLPSRRFTSLLGKIGINGEARSRIHVVHPRDATEASWQSVLRQTFNHARCREADLIILDSLDQYIQVKGGLDPCTSDQVVHMLTTDAPSHCATLAVKALNPRPSEGLSHAIDELQLLGRAADVVAQVDAGPSFDNPTLRRIQFAGRLDAIPSYVLCEMIQGRYERFRPAATEREAVPGDGAPRDRQDETDRRPASEDRAQGDGLRPRSRPSIDRKVVSS